MSDYKSTVFLPSTGFPMKGKLPEREPEWLEKWVAEDLYETDRKRLEAMGGEPFILHDGPPYANGHLHIGHALNKILKDVICRSQRMLGHSAHYVPGWDCHGLPIEWKVEEKYRAEGKNKDEVPVVEFRAECRAFAQKWIDIQREEFKRLGVVGDWDTPYTTMTFAAEAAIVAELGKFLHNGSLYRGMRPVMWSVVEKTALAEAEVEYMDHSSTTVIARFGVVDAAVTELAGASIIIWTTTPWTLPGNRAIGFGADIDYLLIEVGEITEDSRAVTGEKLVVAQALLESLKQQAGISSQQILHRFKGAHLTGTICRHPLFDSGYDFDVPLLPGSFVDVETGTGFVHIAPGHGADDFELGREYGLPVPETVGGDGLFLDDVPLFAGKHVYKVAAEVLAALEDAGALVASGKITHSYPHSWRSKAPLIFRATPQWFISMDKNDLREKALEAIEKTRFIPAAGKNRIRSMVDGRPDWCVSRQRAWGVPITVFVEKSSGEPLRDDAVMARIVEAVAAEGCDAWFTSDPARFLGSDYSPDEYEQVTDILDVWFDSGSTHAFVLEARDDLSSPATLYLEGSDQHRGWFQSSLLESCGTRGRAPYAEVLTHGFVLDEAGRKMSKSLGNVVSPQDVTQNLGADILRLWVAMSDYADDLRIGPDILKATTDSYRRLRNTLRYLLGNLAAFDDAERLAYDEMPELERWVLHRLYELDVLMKRCLSDYDFHTFFTALHNFCAVDLSAFYFDIRKDALYCDAISSTRRRAARTVLSEVFHAITAWLAPVLSFTAEEAWRTWAEESGSSDGPQSVHSRQYPDIAQAWRDDALAEKWVRVRDFRRVVTGALEIERAAKTIGSSLQGAPVVCVDGETLAALEGLDGAEICITSDLDLRGEDAAGEMSGEPFTLEDVPGVAVFFAPAQGEKCPRCWRILPEAKSAEDHLCGRCADAVAS